MWRRRPRALWCEERILPGLDRLCRLRPQAQDLLREAAGLAGAGAIPFAQGGADQQEQLIGIERDNFRALSVEHPRQAMRRGLAHAAALLAAGGRFGCGARGADRTLACAGRRGGALRTILTERRAVRLGPWPLRVAL